MTTEQRQALQARLDQSRNEAATPYTNPGSVEDLRDQAHAAGRRWLIESASHHELMTLKNAAASGPIDFATAFVDGALGAAAEIALEQ